MTDCVVPKIMLISNSANSMVLFRLDFIKALLNRGLQVQIVCLDDDSHAVGVLMALGCKVTLIQFDRCSKNPFQDLLYAYRLYKVIKKVVPDIILNYTIKPVIYGSIVGRIAHVKKIYSMVSGLGNMFVGEHCRARILRRLVTTLYKIAFAVNVKVFFLNPDDQQAFIQRNLLSKEKTIILNGEGVLLSYYQYSENKHQPLNFLMVARLIKNKGVSEFLSAAKMIKNKFPEVGFTLLGAFDDSHPNSISRAELLAIEKIIQYPGAVVDVRPFIEKSSVFVLPSYREGVPRSILEAMAMGRPIITTDAPGCRETVVDGVNGFLIPVQNVAALVEKMEYFIQNPRSCYTMGVESRKIVAQKFDVHQVNQVIMAVMFDVNYHKS